MAVGQASRCLRREPGRSIPYICDELFIAKSTAQTHVRHIYAKMNITGGRQELIDRIEGSD